MISPPDLSGFLAELQKLDKRPKMVQFEIDGICYTSSKLPALLGLDVWTRLAAALGDGVVRVLATGGEMDASAFVLVARALARDGVVDVLRDLMKSTKCGAIGGHPASGKPLQGDLLPHFDDHFAGEYLHLLKVVIFLVAHNLGGPTYGAR